MNARIVTAATLHMCSCGTEYTSAEWSRLPYVGEQADDEESLELRDCVCGSTRAVVRRRSAGPVDAGEIDAIDDALLGLAERLSDLRSRARATEDPEWLGSEDLASELSRLAVAAERLWASVHACAVHACAVSRRVEAK